ncbi:MAG: leucine--tRNA ligase [Chlorobium limicola]|uniref:Leucine--tRNA ligase n=1 Tax=Chlorobium limicola (strain DSM 245 / NBRC 103803 / 6330) TaxID=290315 RepID=SYL_CHLL2|nr:leucine--tRNA ligase [Chlorobium limicola]B3EH05.1 RecName: Full=Leucine--tRNA ligase; AltName: Full=Leucyl-tRNA synthetase; Short=LeuRS [Chlorobium limicola DSM 245]ACD89685.1 leucyl-tRNA synthetase [Chlorobium limicola DSM 245]NTV20603.1 leucine--tRNA ligase [Chlorobium limicola]
MRYEFSAIEKKWQAIWQENGTFKTGESTEKPKYYVLDMFPYPSGSGLHVGHLEGYTASDIIARFKRSRGFNVLHPMGWDAFGLPAEQYAIKTGTHPKITTENNIRSFRETLQAMGFSYDWSKEINTTDPAYFKWTQWIFLRLYEMGLAYMSDVDVNWCEELKTVLANEEVDEKIADGYTVVRKPLRQWVLKITAYAERLLADLDELEWPENVKQMQRNWIGRSEGVEIDFELRCHGKNLRVYTTRPDTLFGATYLVVSPEHPLAEKLATADNLKEVKAYISRAKLKTELERTGLQKDKTGVFTGSYAINPATGNPLPVWISDFVLISYGTGAIMSVPAHDSRDWEFAKKFDLPIIEVIKSPHDVNDAVFEGKESVPVNSSNSEITIDGLPFREAFDTMASWLEKKGAGKRTINYKLRDWIFSRQRYWGEPIPIKHYEDGTLRTETILPLTLPDVEAYQPSETGESPLATIHDWLYGSDEFGSFRRETNTMPQWAGSCWYYLRFIDPENSGRLIDPEREKYWMNVDLYIGGAEHAVLHLLYARFWHKVLFDLNVVSTVEPFRKLFNQGMILGEDNEKMSKSRGNVIPADHVLKTYGADAVRLYEMFLGPLEQVKPWNTNGIEGISRFLGKVWRLVYPEQEGNKAELTDETMPEELLRRLHKTIRKVTEDTEALKFNTAIAEMMVLVNELQRNGCRNRTAVESMILLLAPYAPHIAEELWQATGHTGSISNEPFPNYVAGLATDSVVQIAVQVNGKLRGTFSTPAGTPQNSLIETARNVESVMKFLEGKAIMREIVVPDKLVNFAVK